MKRALCILVILAARRASAFQVGSGVSHACHEQITRDAYLRAMSDRQYAMVPPSGGDWSPIAAKQLGSLGMTLPDRQHELVAFSLINGVRWPDLHGGSLFDVANVRSIHADPADQESHALRAMDDDWTLGDVRALARTRAHILDQIAQARAALAQPVAEQIGTASYYDDDYGELPIAVWEPGFHLAIAAHALQDSFSHTLRTPDLEHVIHVMNYIDAIEGDLEPARDGLAHSLAMDDCSDPATRLLVEAATDATAQLMTAVISGGDVDTVLDAWLTYEPGCTDANGYCGSPWLPLARRDVSTPYVGCEMADRPDANGSEAALLLAVALGAIIRRRRRASRAPAESPRTCWPARGRDA